MTSSKPTRSGPQTRRGIALGWVALPILIGALIFVAARGPGSSSTARGAAAANGVAVKRGPLRISVIASGNLRAAETVRLTSGIEGRTTILSLAPEGSQVREGDLVCELDATTMIEKRIEQNITVGNADAALVKAKQTLEIQHSQNQSDIQSAEQAVEFADQDLQAYLEGERAIELEQAQQAIDLAAEEAQRAENRFAWSEKLSAKGFLTASELEADRIAVHRAKVELQQATRALELLQRFKLPRREAELRAALQESRQEMQRVHLQAKARLVDFESSVRTETATLELEREKLARLIAQIDKATLRAPRDGYVVYAQRDSDEPPIQEGSEVREREEVLSIPSSDGMIAELKLHESVLKQVEAGQRCAITIEALQGLELAGTVQSVAMLPDQNSRWSNPSLRLYGAVIAITTFNAGLRPGMSCAVEIEVDQLADALYVPVQSVFREGRATVCFVVDGGKLERRAVRVGRYNELWVQILEGLEQGEYVQLHAPVDFEGPSIAPEDDEVDDEVEQPSR